MSIKKFVLLMILVWLVMSFLFWWFIARKNVIKVEEEIELFRKTQQMEKISLEWQKMKSEIEASIEWNKNVIKNEQFEGGYVEVEEGN